MPADQEALRVVTQRVVEPDEDLSRFIRDRDEIYKDTGAIKAARLEPLRNQLTGRLELSVSCTSDLSEDEIRDICLQHFDVYRSPQSPAIGRCTAKANVVIAEGLTIDADGIPYAQHANVVGWYDAPGKAAKDIKHFWKDITVRMSKHFKFTSHT